MAESYQMRILALFVYLVATVLFVPRSAADPLLLADEETGGDGCYFGECGSAPQPSAPSPRPQQSAPTGGNLVRIRNDCSEAIDVALHILTTENVWATFYWYAVNGNSTTGFLRSDGLRIVSNNNVIYIYAQSKQNNYRWSGDKYFNVGSNRYGFKEKNYQVDSDGFRTVGFSCD